MRASDRDPVLSTQPIGSVSFNDYFLKQGIRPLKGDLVVSCHGNTDLTLRYARQIQKLADEGNKVVVIAHGGLFFALPSLLAANVPTVPVISIPMDGNEYAQAASFLGAYVPPGTAAIGTVGIHQYNVAAKVACAVLNNQFDGVYQAVHVREKKEDRQLRQGLQSLGVEILGEPPTGMKEGFVVGVPPVTDVGFSVIDGCGDLVVYGTVPDEGYQGNIRTHLNLADKLTNAVWAGRPDAVPYFVAKCLAADHPDIAVNLKAAAEKKAKSYLSEDGRPRELTLESFV